MNPQRLLTKFTLLACIGISALIATRTGAAGAADWNLFDLHGEVVSPAVPIENPLACLDMPLLKMPQSRLASVDAVFTAPDSDSGAETEIAMPEEPPTLKDVGDPAPEDHFEYGYEFDYAYPAGRYAADAYMQEESDKNSDLQDSDLSDDEPIPMLILEDESDLSDALAAMDASEEETVDDPFLLEDEASLATALALLDATAAEDTSDETAWVAVATETEESGIDEETLDGTAEEAVHDWLYYDYTYEPDYFESTEAADELYPDAYAVEADTEETAFDGIDTVDDQTAGNADESETADSDDEDTDAEFTGETRADYPEYYDYDHGMFEYIDGEAKETTENADEDEESTDDATDDSTYYDDPMDSYYGGADWTDYERSHAVYEEAAGEDRIGDSATDGSLFVDEAGEFTGESPRETREEPLRRIYGTWDQGMWEQGTRDRGTVDEGMVDENATDRGTTTGSRFEKSEDENSNDKIPGDRRPGVDNVPADLRRTDEDGNLETE